MAASVMIPRMERQDKRLVDQLRPISFETGIAPNATASVLVTFGRTKVICAVTIEEDVPPLDEGSACGGRLADGGVFHAPLFHA